MTQRAERAEVHRCSRGDDMNMGVWLAVGAGVGAALGAATHEIALGLALGVAVCALLDLLVRRRNRHD